jgi:hypothetical protein
VDNKAILQCPDEVVFIEKTTPSGNMYLEHLLVDKVQEATDNRMFAALLVENGYRDVKLLPQINQTEKALRVRYFGKEYAEKYLTNPDASVSGNLMEFKKSNRRNLSTHIGDAALKSNIAFVRTTEPVTDNYLDLFIERQWKMEDRKNLKEILIYNNGVLRTFTRK